MIPTLPITKGAELADTGFDWRDYKRQVIPFANGWTFHIVLTLKSDPYGAIKLNKTTGITGQNTSPNVIAQWATAGELDTLDPGATYSGELWARRTLDNRDRGPFRFYLHLLRPLGP